MITETEFPAPGDRVRLRYIMGEDGTPYLSDGTTGRVRGRYGRHVLVERDFDGQLVDGINTQEIEVCK